MNSAAAILEKLDQILFIEILENCLQIPRDQFIYKSAAIASATGKNDNFISDIYRLRIGYKLPKTDEQSIDVILKISFDLVNEIKELSVFNREQLMYEDLIVDLERIWKEIADKDINFAPKCFKVTENPCDMIVLEDLKADNYHMISKQHGLDLQQAKFVLSKLAELHAASAVRFLKDNKIMNHCFDRVATHVKHPPDSPVMGSVKMLFNKLVQVAKTLNISSECTKKLEQLPFDVLTDSYFEVAHPMKCGFTVLAHGDLWINNIMFKNDRSGYPIDVKILDYQICFWGSPNADLIYFLFSSVSDDVKVKYFDEIIEFYYKELRNSLINLKYNEHIPTIEELNEDLMANRMYANQLFLHIIPITRNCSSSTLEIKDLFSGTLTDEKLNFVFMNENFLKVLSSWLPIMNDKGFLDM